MNLILWNTVYPVGMKLQRIEASVVEVCVHLHFCILRNGEF